MKNPAFKRYIRCFIPTMIVYVLTVMGVSSILGEPGEPTGVPAYALAILPALPIIAVFWIMGRYLVEETDEYLRLLMVRQMLVATGFTMSLATLWGFLEIFVDAPHIPLFFVPVTWFAGLGVGSVWNRIKA
jgi:hypothetical protein